VYLRTCSVFMIAVDRRKHYFSYINFKLLNPFIGTAIRLNFKVLVNQSTNILLVLRAGFEPGTYGCKVSKPSYSNVVTQTQCTLCNGSHRLFNCDKFLKLQTQQLFNHAKQRRVCLSCLQSFNKDYTCSKQVCHNVKTNIILCCI